MFDMWGYNSFRPYENWHIRTWNTFRTFNRIKGDSNYYSNNLLNNSNRRLTHTPFLRNTHAFTEKHCFNANRQIWGNNSYIAAKGFWTPSQVYKDPVLVKTNNFIVNVKQICNSYIIDNFNSSLQDDGIYNLINQENKALRRIESIKITKDRLLSDISTEELYNKITQYKKEQSFLSNSNNSKRKPFSNWLSCVFDSYETNFYEIERKHAALLVDRIDLHFDLDTGSYYIQRGIIDDIRNSEVRLLRKILSKPFFN